MYDRARVLFIFLAILAFAELVDLGAALPQAQAHPRREKTTAEPSGRRAAQDIIAITNRERIKHKLPPLKVDQHCVSAIAGHVKDMAMGRYLNRAP